MSIPADLNDYLRKCCRQHLRRYVAMEFMLSMVSEDAPWHEIRDLSAT